MSRKTYLEKLTFKIYLVNWFRLLKEDHNWTFKKTFMRRFARQKCLTYVQGTNWYEKTICNLPKKLVPSNLYLRKPKDYSYLKDILMIFFSLIKLHIFGQYVSCLLSSNIMCITDLTIQESYMHVNQYFLLHNTFL